MDILFYEILKEELISHNEKSGKPYGNVIVPYATSKTSYPHTVLKEIRNVSNTQFNSPHDRVASVGYRTDIYAKTQNSIDKETIARQVAQIVDRFFTYKGLPRVSFNVSFEGQDQCVCHIVMTYMGNLSEYRRTII